MDCRINWRRGRLKSSPGGEDTGEVGPKNKLNSRFNGARLWLQTQPQRVVVRGGVGNVGRAAAGARHTAALRGGGSAAFTPLQRANGIERRIRFGRGGGAGGEAG
jgi:hypothetical protein